MRKRTNAVHVSTSVVGHIHGAVGGVSSSRSSSNMSNSSTFASFFDICSVLRRFVLPLIFGYVYK